MIKTTNKPKRLIQDDDFHWYLIDTEDNDEFRKWVESWDGLGDNKKPLKDFTNCRIDGPHLLNIYSWEEI